MCSFSSFLTLLHFPLIKARLSFSLPLFRSSRSMVNMWSMLIQWERGGGGAGACAGEQTGSRRVAADFINYKVKYKNCLGAWSNLGLRTPAVSRVGFRLNVNGPRGRIFLGLISALLWAQILLSRQYLRAAGTVRRNSRNVFKRIKSLLYTVYV